MPCPLPLPLPAGEGSESQHRRLRLRLLLCFALGGIDAIEVVGSWQAVYPMTPQLSFMFMNRTYNKLYKRPGNKVNLFWPI